VACVLALLLAICAMPLTLAGCSAKPPLLSATYTVSEWPDVQTAVNSARSGDTIDMSGLWSPDIQYNIIVPQGIELTLVGHKDVVFTGVAFSCEGRNTLTSQDLGVAAANNLGYSALDFSGNGNRLILVGANVIRNGTGAERTGFGAGIGVSEGVDLTISGAGSLSVTGGKGGAGIGGGMDKPGGAITINLDVGGAVSVVVDGDGAGIGGGSGGNAGAITITGGRVSVIGGGLAGLALRGPAQAGDGPTASGGAGIGAGKGGSASSISVAGGMLAVSVDSSGAALGGGEGGAGGSISITGGSASCVNSGPGPGIGGGTGGEAASITMRGGSLNAESTGPALNASFAEMPASYHWRTDPSANGDITMVYPGDPFKGSDSHRRVQIESAEVISIMVTPASAEVPKGSTQAFTAAVMSTGGANSTYRWSVSGHNSQGTFIDSEGVLTVAPNESATAITVTATSNFNANIVGEAKVTVVSASSSTP
jgi:hypothetical protein